MWFNEFAQPNSKHGTIMFCRKASQKTTHDGPFAFHYSDKKDETIPEPNSRQLFLFSKFCEFSIFEVMPTTFTISTKNNICQFNIEMLKEVSPVISDLIQNNPDETNFNLNINDEENVLVKFEQLFQGQTVVFEEDELPSSQQITKKLQIKNCPNYLKPNSLINNEIDSDGNKASYISTKEELKLGVLINQKLFIEFLKDPSKIEKFTIRVNKKEYKCNIFGACSSNIIRQILEKDSTIREYNYDFDDEFNEFQLICNLFNFNQIDLNKNNIDSIKQIAEDLQINCIMNQIDDFIKNYDKISQKVNEHQIIIDSISNLFDLLYNIKNYGIDKVEISIIQSNWSQTEEEVQELAAFILQVAKSNLYLQNEMAELIIRLNNESHETNKLNILMPFIVQNIKTFYLPPTNQSYLEQNFDGCYFGTVSSKYTRDEFNDIENKFIFSFIRILNKHGIITKNEIKEALKNYDYRNRYFNAFFLPEIIELKPNDIDKLFDKNVMMRTTFHEDYKKFISFVEPYFPDKIDVYQKIIDNLEPDDELTKSLIHDDVDKLQSIIITNKIDIPKAVVPYNILDDLDDTPTLINYSAFCGSIKCFKYLLLNEGQIDENTFYFAVYGKNNEIIKIVDQKPINAKKPNYKMHEKNNRNINYYNDYSYIKKCDYCSDEDIISSTIKMHQNDLFDWIFENRFMRNNKIENNLNNIAKIAALNGNAYALIEIIEKGFDVSLNDIISYSAKNGFCKFAQLILNIMDKHENEHDAFKKMVFQSLVQFGNKSILELFIKIIDQENLEHDIIYAIGMNYRSIVNYFFDIIDKIIFKKSKRFILYSLKASLKMKTDELFNFCLNKFKQLYPDIFYIETYDSILGFACSYSNFPVIKSLIEIILKKDSKFDFYHGFLEAASTGSTTICQYFIDKKVYINYNKFRHHVSQLGSFNVKIFEMILKKVNPLYKYKLLKCIDKAIENKNKDLIEFLLKEKAPIEKALILAVQTKDVEIVDLILKYNSKPSFVNQRFLEDGDALHMAICYRDLKIVKRLLSVPGIDPSTDILRNPIYNFDFDIIDEILNFYGDNIQSQTCIIIEAIKNLLNDLNSYGTKNDSNNKKRWKLILKFLNIKSIDPNIYFNNSNILCQACYNNEVEFVENLLKIENIDVNKYNYDSYMTPLMIALERKNLEIVYLLLKHPKINVNLKAQDELSSLNLAINCDLKEIVEVLINDERIDPIEIGLDYAFYSANSIYSKILATSPYLDVNHAFDLNHYSDEEELDSSEPKIKEFDELEKTALINCVETNNIEKLKIVINHSSFDAEKSNTKIALFIAAKDNNIKIFKILLNLINNDVNICDPIYGFSLLAYAAKNLSGDIVDEILNNQMFDYKSYQIVYAFVQSFKNPTKAESVVEIMNKIYKFDLSHARLIDFSKPLKNGKSFFTSIKSNYYKIEDVCNFLLIHGVDPNMPDKNGVFPLQHSIEKGLHNLTTFLIDSNKIVLSQLPDGNSYLHLSISCSNSNAFQFFIKKKLIDINIVNDKGETPLMEACRTGDLFVVDLLFQQENLDYLHCDKNGNDALKLLKSLSLEEEKEARQNRDCYYKTLISLVNKMLDENDFNY